MSRTVTNRLKLQLQVTRTNYGATGNYFHARMSPIYFDTPEPTASTPYDIGVRTPSFGAYGETARKFAHLADLRISAQRDTDGAGAWYGPAVTFADVHTADLARCESMVKTLRAVMRKMDAETAARGYARDFAEYAVRAAIALGADTRNPFAMYSQALRPDGTHWRFFDADSLADLLARPDYIATVSNY